MGMCVPQVGLLEVRDEQIAGAAFVRLVDAHAVEAHDVRVLDAAQDRRFLLQQSRPAQTTTQVIL